MYYVIHKQNTLLKATIHLGNHDHLVVDGVDKDTLQEITILVQGKQSCTPNIKNYVIALTTKKTFLVRQLFNEDGDAPITMSNMANMTTLIIGFVVIIAIHDYMTM
jgi:hypothetical protein